MTVAPVTLAALVIATLVVALLPIGLHRFLRKPLALDRRDAIVGVAVYTVFATLLERGLYAILLSQPSAVLWLSKPVTFAVFGTVVAALFEEIGRYLGLRFLAKRYGPSDGDARGLSNGIGHGGAQAWFVGVVVLAQWVYLAWLANRGELNAQLSTMPADLALRIQVMLATMSPVSVAVSALERVAAFVVQLALSVLMWRGMRANKRWILPAMIVLHPVIDLPSILYNGGGVPFEWMVALYLLLTAGFAGALMKLCRPARAAR
ncbi:MULTISPECIES: YhfC family intramembrane metalloprotease [Burkholderia]|uniref:YhfC family intramembrane metalloprotease n=1 Tax=Burkholderia savannae TaxID=1637837 RepID=A0ABR5THI8_9BURK|nr:MULTISPECIES: YhfC family intramembrane metalloprotease [Burkholderia]AOK47013.1 hypothetical protein WT60_09265 [Burkholderia sp. MSMB617WGS]KVG45669.1 hypothetical protein WS77_06085 [Burkholderia sp. MSMB0265]KVG87643.1 hypothetical protein WS81_26555 [Burkholderia sp. MSMB2040]KVG99055.1 hypothetical protein WS83_27325 [Burkholderia sp. MSMB2042]KVG99575.1 hypothetical protein WS82_24240 [Burkholderia sp. MSMB2041]